ncbi:metallophosphoesterase [Bacillus infantis]|uniref:metallophosphoesterase n=1 Tax=Bacillus infantis TaxID=324767 RepID=UPI003CE7E88D
MSLYFFLIISVYLVYSLIKANKNTSKIAVRTVSVERPDIVLAGNKIKILHLSDLHLENISISPKELYERIAGKDIDLIALTGDFMDRKWSLPKLAPYLQMLNKLEPRYGMYAVFGNHDYVLKGKNFADLKKILEENGCRTLQNEHSVIDINGEKLNIIGIDNYSTKHHDVAQSYSGASDGYNLVLTHDPNVVLER